MPYGKPVLALLVDTPINQGGASHGLIIKGFLPDRG